MMLLKSQRASQLRIRYRKAFCSALLSSEALARSSVPSGPLLQYFLMKIKATGPITVAEYMRECLTSPAGYYSSSANAIGSSEHASDFFTSPEVSQVFGEIIAVWFVQQLSLYVGRLTSTEQYDVLLKFQNGMQLVELGPGRGTLVSDMLQAFQKFKFLACSSDQRKTGSTKKGPLKALHFVEASRAMIQEQARKLGADSSLKFGHEREHDYVASAHSMRYDLPVCWHADISTIPRGIPTIFVAHEFFDALPVHIFKKNEHGQWRELLVDADHSSEESASRLRFVLSPTMTANHALLRLFPAHELERCDSIEVSSHARLICSQIAQRIRDDSGFGLIVDYGYDTLSKRSNDAYDDRPKDTLRSFTRHTQSDPLSNPGKHDITADVDFGLLQRVCFADDVAVAGPVTQAQFLTQLGIGERCNALLRKMGNEQIALQNAIVGSYKTLVEEMGPKFLVMGVLPKSAVDDSKPHVAGFASYAEGNRQQ